MGVSAIAAIIAGLVSFLSPCVLPLVPGYLSMLSGIGVEQLQQGEGPRAGLLRSALAFVVGFSIVFIAFGASATAVGAFLVRNRSLLAPVAGALILLFGLYLVGVLAKISVRAGLVIGVLLVAIGVAFSARPSPAISPLAPVRLFSVALIFLLGASLTRWLNRDVHFRGMGGRPGMVSGFLMGFAFAFGWTPCISPILSGVLGIAATREKVSQGIFLLACYSAGLAIPFLVTAVGVGSFLHFYQRFRRHLHNVEVLSGILLLLVGGLVFTNRLTWLSGKLSDVAAHKAGSALFSWRGDAGSSQDSAQANLPDEPDVTFTDLQGNSISLESLKGKVVLVNFWATWCDPCMDEMPSLIQFQQRYASQGFTLLGVAMDDEGASVVAPFVHQKQFDVDGRSMSINYPIVLGNDDIAQKFGGLFGYPVSVLISRDGKIRKKYLGAIDDDEVRKEIESLL